MSYLDIKIKTGTGRATCKICNKIISKECTQITISGIRIGLSIHADAKDCNRLAHILNQK